MKEFFGAMMRPARAKAKITLRELSQAVGCTPSFLSEVETGLRPAPKDEHVVIRIASALQIPQERALEAAKRDRERRDMKFIKELFSQDDQLAACYCRAKETCTEDELKRLFREVFERAATSKQDKC